MVGGVIRIYGRKSSANCMWPSSGGKLDYKLILNAKKYRKAKDNNRFMGRAREVFPSEDEMYDFIEDEMDDFIGVKASTNP